MMENFFVMLILIIYMIYLCYSTPEVNVFIYCLKIVVYHNCVDTEGQCGKAVTAETKQVNHFSAYLWPTVLLVTHTNPETAAILLQHIIKIEKWLQDKQMKANPSKCNYITFALRKRKPPNIQLNGTHITQTRTPFSTQLTWKQHTKSIIDKIQIKRRQMYWLTSRSSKLSIENKLKIHKTIIKPIWTYGIQLWGQQQ